MAVEVPGREKPGIAAQVGIQKVNVATDENDCWNEKPAREKEPERQRPGEVLKRKSVAQREDNDVDACDGSAEFRYAALKTTQPCDHER